MLVLTVLTFTAVFGLALFAIGETIAGSRGKILAALAGQSELSRPTPAGRPITVRIAPRSSVQPVTARPRLRAAA